MFQQTRCCFYWTLHVVGHWQKFARQTLLAVLKEYHRFKPINIARNKQIYRLRKVKLQKHSNVYEQKKTIINVKIAYACHHLTMKR
jgi:hypothetical protein